MIAIVTVLTAFPLGFFLRSRTSAVLAYVALYCWAFTFQSVYLMLYSLHGDANPAFTVGHYPLSYGVVTASIYAVGHGLVFLGHRVGAARRSRTAGLAVAEGTSLAA